MRLDSIAGFGRIAPPTSPMDPGYENNEIGASCIDIRIVESACRHGADLRSMCRLLGRSENMKHKETLQKVVATMTAARIRKHAEDALRNF
jgi:hypothetical protein